MAAGSAAPSGASGAPEWELRILVMMDGHAPLELALDGLLVPAGLVLFDGERLLILLPALVLPGVPA